MSKDNLQEKRAKIRTKTTRIRRTIRTGMPRTKIKIKEGILSRIASFSISSNNNAAPYAAFSI